MSSLIGIDMLGDIFPYLADMIVDNDDVCVETVIDSLYGYGMLHGQNMQTKVEQSPFYTKHYKKLTVKQQQQLRAGKETPEDSENDDSSVEAEPKKLAVGKGKRINKRNIKESPHVPVVSNTGRTFIGVVPASSPRAGLPSPDGKMVKKASATGTARGIFEAVIHVGQRKVTVGQYATLEEAAQAHDRALIRANGPTSCRPVGLLNFPLSFYAGDSLSKFAAFDTILKKQLFGSDWSGPKACDFGFLMTQLLGQPAAGAGKIGTEFSPMDGSTRRKKHKGQYSEWDDESEAVFSGGVGAAQRKKLLYGNYYVMAAETGKRARGVGESPEDSEEPYFKSPSPFDLGANRKASAAKPEDPNQARVGDTLVVMHGERERRSGRAPYERGILLERTAAAGWWRIGFADHTTKNLRGEQVHVMGSCETNTKFMRAPLEAITEQDAALRAYYDQRGLIVYGRGNGPRPVFALSRPANPVLPSPPSNLSGALALSAVSTVVKPAFPEKQLQRAAEVYLQHYRSQEVVATVLGSTRPPSTRDRDPDDPWSLYELADYTRASSGATPATQAAVQGTLDASAQSDFALDWLQSESASNSSGTSRARPSRFALVRTPSSAGPQSGDRPANFHIFTSSTFGHKMTDILAAACYILPQEFALLQRTLRGMSAAGGCASPRAPTPLGQGAANLANLWSPSSEVSEHSLAGEGMVPDRSTAADPSPSASASALGTSSVPQPRWLQSLLTPSSPDTSAVLFTFRKQITEFITSSAAIAGVGSLVARLLSDTAYEGVIEIPAVDASTDGDAPRRYTFELPAGNKMLMTDLGISAAVVLAGLHCSSAISSSSSSGSAGSGVLAGLPPSVDAPGVVTVGYFSSALEAALVREQVLGLTRSNFGVNSSYCVDATANFNAAEWGELRRIGKLLSRFTRKNCLP